MKIVQWEPSCYPRTEGIERETVRRMTKLIVALLNFADAPKN